MSLLAALAITGGAVAAVGLLVAGLSIRALDWDDDDAWPSAMTVNGQAWDVGVILVAAGGLPGAVASLAVGLRALLSLLVGAPG